MKVFNKVKGIVYVAALTLTLGISASAAKIESDPTVTYKNAPVEIGDEISVNSVSNLKINGKSLSKYKKKVKAIRTYHNTRGVSNPKDVTIYINDEIEDVFAPDSEDAKQSADNEKYIATDNYNLKFLKTGTYKISYDQYYGLESTESYNADGKTKTIKYTLKKKHYEELYKVVQTVSPIKKITLGKNKITYINKSTATKKNTKTIINYRFLQGSKGKLTFSANKNYKITSAYVVTYNEKGDAVYTPAGNKKTVKYGTNKSKWVDERRQIVQDANGKNATKEDPVTGDIVYEFQKVKVGYSNSKYKPTTIVYGYKDSYTGSYTNYALSTRTVYQRKCDDKSGDTLYQKNADGTYAKDDKGNKIPVVETVNATVITSTYPSREKKNGVYSNVKVVSEQVIIPNSITKVNGNYYYLDATCTGYRYYAGQTVVSKDGISRFIYVTYPGDTYATRTQNPQYQRAFYNATYVGSWQQVTDANRNDYYTQTSYDLDGQGNRTTEYRWIPTKNAQQQYEYIKDLKPVDLGGRSNSIQFNKK